MTTTRAPKSPRDLRVVQSRSPQDPQDVVCEIPVANAAAVRLIASRAKAGARSWAAVSAFERGAALHRAADALARHRDFTASLVVREVGKPVQEARGEVDRAVAILRYFAQAALDADGELLPSADGPSWLLARRRPRGVVLVVTPWNFPIAIPIWKIAPALAWGNAVLWKPASHAVATALRLMDVLGLPSEVLSIVPGGGGVATTPIDDPAVAAVSFTGSVDVGRRVALRAAGLGKPAQVEMGGSNPAVVLRDAEVQRAAALIARSAMGYAGRKLHGDASHHRRARCRARIPGCARGGGSCACRRRPGRRRC